MDKLDDVFAGGETTKQSQSRRLALYEPVTKGDGIVRDLLSIQR